MTGDSSAEITAGPDGQTASDATGEKATDAARGEVPSPPAAVEHSGNGQGETHPAAVEPTPADAPAAEAPAAEAPAAEAPAAEAPAADQPAAEAPSADASAITPDAERPAVGPRILGVAAEPKPLPTVKASLPTRKRRRRVSAAERHRRAFFSALTDLRRGGTLPGAAGPDSSPSGEPAPAADAGADAGAAPGEQTPAPGGAGEASDADRSPTSPARVTAAIERVGGPEVIKEALKPKQDEKGQPLKWAAVCAQSAEGMKPGDPVFNAWVRLAATPVREVKALLPRPPAAERSQRGEGGGGRRPGAQRSGGGGGRPRRDDRPNRSEYASHAQDGTLRKSIRIVTGHDEDQERRERERNRKEQREAKRRAERERLARLGY